MSLLSKFGKLATDHSPGQEIRQGGKMTEADLRGERLTGTPVDFSHGDVDAHEPLADAHAAFAAGIDRGGSQAYSEYRGDLGIRELVAERLASFTGAPVDAADGLIITPGTQGALFLADGLARRQGCHRTAGLFRQSQAGGIFRRRDRAGAPGLREMATDQRRS